MKYSEKISNKLNELLTKNYDAEAGYKNAADNVKSTNLKQFFTLRAKERYDFGHQLKQEITSYGETPDKGTSFKGDVHRAWMDLKSAVSNNNDEAVLEEAVRGEKAAIKEYNELLAEPNLPPTVENLIKTQRNSVETALSKVQTLETVA
ncbi:MAG: PA2169 family four-helix-bundle protein [Leeuwenhoekiella sp.]